MDIDKLIPIVDEIFDTFVVIFINFINNLKTIVDAIFIKKKDEIFNTRFATVFL
jgi:hypothetical protein